MLLNRQPRCHHHPPPVSLAVAIPLTYDLAVCQRIGRYDLFDPPTIHRKLNLRLFFGDGQLVGCTTGYLAIFDRCRRRHASTDIAAAAGLAAATSRPGRGRFMVLGRIDDLPALAAASAISAAIVAVGDNATRSRLVDKVLLFQLWCHHCEA